MRNIVVLIFAVLLVSNCAESYNPWKRQGLEVQAGPHRILITLSGGSPKQQIISELLNMTGGVVAFSPMVHVPVVIGEFDIGLSDNALTSMVEKVNSLDQVERVEEDSVTYTPGDKELLAILGQSVFDGLTDWTASRGVTPNDTLVTLQWGLFDMNMQMAWKSTTGVGHNTLVAVLDTGVDYNHPDLKANMFVNTAELTGIPFVDDDGNGYVDDIYGWNAVEMNGDPFDDHWHGTHCAGILGAATNNSLGVAGVNWGPSIVPCKFLGQNGQGRLSDAITCIDYSLAIGATVSSNSWNIDVYSHALAAAIQMAADGDQIFVVAAGNSGTNNDDIPEYPAAYNISNIISVAALTPYNELAEWSNYGPSTVHIAAPGFKVASIVPNTTYGYASGTSMAAPYAAGVVSLLRGYHPEWDAEMVKAVLQLTAAPIEGSGKLITDGKVDAEAAVEFISVGTTPFPLEIGEEFTVLAISTESCSVSCQQSGLLCDEEASLAINSDLDTCMATLDESSIEGTFVKGEAAERRTIHPGGCFVTYWTPIYTVELNTNGMPLGCDDVAGLTAASYKVCACRGYPTPL